jgi:hypothetical protein
MGDEGDFWHAVREHKRKEKEEYESSISGVYRELCNHPLTREVGDHHRLDMWDFWYTGTVMNIKTKQYTSLKNLLNMYKGKTHLSPNIVTKSI